MLAHLNLIQQLQTEVQDAVISICIQVLSLGTDVQAKLLSHCLQEKTAFLAGIQCVDNLCKNTDDHRIFFNGQDASRALIIEDLSIVLLTLDCNVLILNPSFENGITSFQKPDANDDSKVDHIFLGADRPFYALRNYERLSGTSRGTYQPFIPDAQLKVKNTILDRSNSSGFFCNANERNGDLQFPSVKIRGLNCSE